MKSDLIDIDMQIHHRTDRAVLASANGDREAAVWLPIAHIEVAPKERGISTITVPAWLAYEKGLV